MIFPQRLNRGVLIGFRIPGRQPQDAFARHEVGDVLEEPSQ